MSRLLIGQHGVASGQGLQPHGGTWPFPRGHPTLCLVYRGPAYKWHPGPQGTHVALGHGWRCRP